MTDLRYALLALLPLCACVDAASAPMVSDFNGNTVKVIYHRYALGANYQASPVYATAAQTCGTDAVYQGVRVISEYQGEHIFLCRK